VRSPLPRLCLLPWDAQKRTNKMKVAIGPSRPPRPSKHGLTGACNRTEKQTRQRHSGRPIPSFPTDEKRRGVGGKGTHSVAANQGGFPTSCPGGASESELEVSKLKNLSSYTKFRPFHFCHRQRGEQAKKGKKEKPSPRVLRRSASFASPRE